jgi:bifunctional non-homologous end joining protein LigD
MARYYSKHNGEDQDYLMCNNLPTLVWLGQLAAIELHSSYSRVDPGPDALGISDDAGGSRAGFASSILNYPDFLVFDIDPYVYSGKENVGDEPELNERAFAMTCDAALWIKGTLDALGLTAFVKTTGRTGLHVFVPIVRQFTYDTVRATSETIALHVLRQHPRELTTEWQVSKRTGKIFLDYNQGARMKTLAAIYSPRAAVDASVSVPLRWDELGTVYPTDFTVHTVPERLAEVGDLWADILDAKHDLRALIG